MEMREKTFGELRREHGVVEAIRYKIQKINETEQEDIRNRSGHWKRLWKTLRERGLGRALAYDRSKTDKRLILGTAGVTLGLYLAASFYTGEAHPGAILYKLVGETESHVPQSAKLNFEIEGERE